MKARQSFREFIDERSIHLTSAYEPVKHAVFGKTPHLHRVVLRFRVEALTLIAQQESSAIANYWHDAEIDFRCETPIQAHLFDMPDTRVSLLGRA